MEYTSLSDYCKETFGEKLYKLSLDSGCTCPNRDGLLDTRGCLFCSAGGSGDFAAARNPLDRQLEEAKRRIRNKFPEGDSEEGRYIAYVQSFTGTYPGKDGFVKDANGVSSFDRMRKRYLALVQRPEVRVLSIATRPDCLGPEALDLLKELRAIKPVWVELGLQTSNEETAEYIRRCYRNEVYEQAVQNLNALDIPVITHVIDPEEIIPPVEMKDLALPARFVLPDIPADNQPDICLPLSAPIDGKGAWTIPGAGRSHGGLGLVSIFDLHSILIIDPDRPVIIEPVIADVVTNVVLRPVGAGIGPDLAGDSLLLSDLQPRLQIAGPKMGFGTFRL